MTDTRGYILRRRGMMALAWLLLVAMLLPLCALPAVADASKENTVTTAAPVSGLTEMSPSELMAVLLDEGETMPSAEAEWLDHHAPIEMRAAMTVTYDHTIPTRAVILSYGTYGGVTLTATPVTTTQGTTGLTWYPLSVTMDGQTYPLTAVDGAYTLQLPDTAEEGARVTVHYEAALVIAVEDSNRWLNAAYEVAVAAEEEYLAYELALQEHEAAEAAYPALYAAYEEALVQYRADMALYQAYQKELKAYQSQLQTYKAYLVELENYNAALNAYNTYLAEKEVYDQANALYMEFINDPAAYEARYRAYCAWLDKMDTVKKQLEILETCFLGDSMGHVLYNTLKGPTVATVVERQDELVSAGCSEVDITNADQATARLSALLDAYPREGTEGERYAFYIAHYTDIKNNVRLLYTSLATLYNNDLVPDILDMQDRKTRYWQFVGQLYVLSCLLDDAEVWQSTWSIAGAQLLSVVESCYLLTDHNKATPLAAYPAPVQEVPAPDAITKPVEPIEVARPTKPTEVSEPVKPAEVRRPTVPVAPQRPVAPTPPAFSTEQEALRQAAMTGNLTYRTDRMQDTECPLYTRLDCVVAAVDIPRAYFYAYDRVTLLDWCVADKTGKVTLPEAPARPDDQGHTYVFAGWVDADGHKVTGNTLTLTEDTALYATYTAIPKTYTVSWVVDGQTIDREVPYGTIPTFDGSTAKSPDETSLYQFTGWSPTPVAVTGDTTYTAQYRAIPRTYTVLWQWGEGEEDRLSQDGYHYGETPTLPDEPLRPADGRYLYNFTGWSPEVSPITGDTLYYAVFETIDLLPQLPADATVSVSENEQGWTVNDRSDMADDGAWLVDISRVTTLAAEDGVSLALVSDGLTVTLQHRMVQALAATSAVWLSVERADNTFACVVYDEEHRPLTTEPLSLQITLTPADGQSVRLYYADGDLLASGNAGAATSFTVVCGESYNFYQGYPIVVSETAGGLCKPSTTLSGAEETVTLSVTAQPGYAVDGVTVTTADGTEIALTPAADGTYTMTMPASGVTVTPRFTPLTYCVTFTSNGILLSKKDYRYGEIPTPPAAPTKPEDDTYRYEFTGWTPRITAVLGEATYEAEFLAIPLYINASVEDTALKLWQAVLIGAAAFVVTTAAILVPYFVVRKKGK